MALGGFSKAFAEKPESAALGQAPQVEATVTLENDKQLAEQLLDRFGRKYPLGWVVYGSRFRKGLADGSRVLLRYSLAA